MPSSLPPAYNPPRYTAHVKRDEIVVHLDTLGNEQSPPSYIGEKKQTSLINLLCPCALFIVIVLLIAIIIVACSAKI